MVKLLLPQEIETYYVIPAIRSHFADLLIKLGMQKKQVADIFGVTAATISQYRSKKRGNEIAFDTVFKEEVMKSAAKITNQESYIRETQHVLKVLRSTKTFCEIHKKFSTTPVNCEPGDMGCTTKDTKGNVAWKMK